MYTGELQVRLAHQIQENKRNVAALRQQSQNQVNQDQAALEHACNQGVNGLRSSENIAEPEQGIVDDDSCPIQIGRPSKRMRLDQSPALANRAKEHFGNEPCRELAVCGRTAITAPQARFGLTLKPWSSLQIASSSSPVPVDQSCPQMAVQQDTTHF